VARKDRKPAARREIPRSKRCAAWDTMAKAC
jgi:hypothetical protein